MPFLVANSWLGLQAETTYGSAASVGIYTPVQSPKVTTDLKWLDDSALRGSATMHYDQVPGVIKSMYDFKSYIYGDVSGNLFRAALGSTDTVASVGPSTWTHTIGLNYAPNLGSQPPSYTINNYSVDNTYQIVGSRLVSLAINVPADAAAEATVQFTGNKYATTASVSVNETASHFVPGWNCSASIGGVASTVVEDFSVDIKRGTAPIFVLNQQGPYQNWVGPADISGKISLVLELGSTFYANALTRDQQQLLVQLTDPVSTNSFLMQFSAAQFEAPIIDQSKNYVQITSNFVAVANTVDATVAGYSPMKVVITNNTATAY